MVRHCLVEKKILYCSSYLLFRAPNYDVLQDGEPVFAAVTISQADSCTFTWSPAPWSLFAGQAHPAPLEQFLENTAALLVGPAEPRHIPDAEAPVPPWVARFYAEPRERASMESLDALFDEMGELLTARRLDEINTILATIAIDKVPPEIVMGVIRVTFTARDRLSSWAAARNRAFLELKRRNLPAERIMVGLLAGPDERNDQSRQ